MARKRAAKGGGDTSFVIDTHGDAADGAAPIPEYNSPPPIFADTQPESDVFAGLVLPGHVEVVGGNSDSGNAASAPPAAEPDHIADASGDYEQLDAAAGGSRYYETDEANESRTVCTVCGEFGHGKKKCPHTHCLACGAVDEHSTRNCPLGTTCFRCGGVGHRAMSCPQPRTGSRRSCDRCGSSSHPAASCPTLWRIYNYCTPEEHEKLRAKKAHTQARREARHAARSRASRKRGWAASLVEESDLSSSDSGEDEAPADWDPVRKWCYNCAKSGHWGDDCDLRRANPTRPTGEPSAFSQIMADSGPFELRKAPLRHPRHTRPAPPKRPAHDMDGEVLADDWFSRRQALARTPRQVEEPKSLKERLGGWANQAREVLRPRKVRRSGGHRRDKAPFTPQYRGGYV
ncbi:hypothetical protein MCUN1_003138 [Malassezia cuniculi]|uniref:CCHC-type domain-containing protein n=1 Tax=Malassezia cuniculi TaxID=948313 RepID=A0AAF0EWD5_9BASI|nr:hypothetical protein MCUN1_003138 [Malassezia cuniculi]